jgi:Membrane bound O-acyl transferase family
MKFPEKSIAAACIPAGNNRVPDVAEPAWVGWLALVIFPIAAVACHRVLQPWVLMWTIAFALFFGCKWLTWWQARTPDAAPWRNVAYFFGWVGMDAPEFFNERRRAIKPRGGAWLAALLKIAFGAGLLWLLVPAIPASQTLLKGWVGMTGVVFILHFGLFELMALTWRTVGIAVTPLMNAPIKSRSLAEFWGRRWNTAFNRVAHDLVFRPLRRRVGAATATMLAFLASGLLHDLILSVPARAGYGLPTAYFMLQGAGLLFERSPAGRRLGLGRGRRGRIFTIMVTTLPAFWLFNPSFVRNVILPMLYAIGAT